MFASTELSEKSFSRRWMSFNLIGWIIGFVLTVILSGVYQKFQAEIYNYSPLLHYLFMFLVWLPLGATIGIMQSIILKQLRIKRLLWVLITTFGWWIPFVAISLYYEYGYLEHGFPWTSWSLKLEAVIIGASIGASQAYLLKSSILKSSYWFYTTTMVTSILVLLSNYHETIVDAIVNVPVVYLVFGGFTLLLREILSLVAFVVFPFFGALLTSLPTGKILLKHGNWPPINSVT